MQDHVVNGRRRSGAARPVGARPGGGAASRTTLDIYVVDVEGGNATLFVAPSGESLLIDSGNAATGGVGLRTPNASWRQPKMPA